MSQTDNKTIQPKPEGSINPNVNNIKPIVLGLESLSGLRIATGNRIAANFAHRHGLKSEPGKSGDEYKDQDEKMYARILEDLKDEYGRISDAIAQGAADKQINDYVGKVPSAKKFVPSPLFSNYSELLLVDQYLGFLDMEAKMTKQLESALMEYRIYSDYLLKIPGIGPKMAGVIISELDPYKAKYPTSFWRFSGLDTVVVGEYTDDQGKVHRISPREIDDYYKTADDNIQMMVGGYPVTFVTLGRTRESWSQVDISYINKDGEEAIRRGITFNPFLKTKMLGVMAPGFLKTSVTYMDDVKASSKERLAKAASLGFVSTKTGPALTKEGDAFLRAQGVKVYVQYSRFGEHYYNRKQREEGINQNRPKDKQITPMMIHRRALRYMTKEFLRELHIVWRWMEGLPNYEPYETAKLGYNHIRNNFIYKEFGIDSTEFISVNDSKPAVLYAPAVQAYIDQRNKQAAVMASSLKAA